MIKLATNTDKVVSSATTPAFTWIKKWRIKNRIHKSPPRHPGLHPGTSCRSFPFRRQRRWLGRSMATAESPSNPDVARRTAIRDEPAPSAACACHIILANQAWVSDVTICIIVPMFATFCPSSRLHITTRSRDVCLGHEWRLVCRVGDRTLRLRDVVNAVARSR